MRTLSVFAFCLLPSLVSADVTVDVSVPRSTYYRGETVHADVTIANDNAEVLTASHLEIDCGGIYSRTVLVPEIAPKNSATVPVTFATGELKSSQDYTVTFQLMSDDGQPLAEEKTVVRVVRKPDAHRLNVWIWTYGGPVDVINNAHNVRARDVGFTVAGGPVFPYSPPDADPQKTLRATRSSFESMMRSGMDISMVPVGIWHREYNLIQPRGALPLVEAEPAAEGEPEKPPEVHPDDDTRYKGAGRNGHEYFNPFHPEVARQQNYANELMMRELGDFPNLKYAFVDAEFVDDVYYHNANAGGLELMKKKLGFTRDEIGKPNFVAPGVLADDDRGLAYRRFAYQEGNGVNLALERAADAVHRHRPDVQFISDPYRSVALLDMFPGCDIISTWTYTNPDPKLMLYIETLRAICKPAGQEPLHVVTLLNYPGEVVPEAHDKNWMMMGPGRLLETTWINLSRAPKIVGYYAFDGYYDSELAFSQPSMDAMHNLSEQIFKPYGPLLTQLAVSPRKIAVLSSESSRLYNASPGLLGYPNYQPYHFYTVLAMAHLNADVVFDETIERYGFDGYDVLVLPKCDVLTETVYKKVKQFQDRGGIVIADQYLGPDIPEAIRFDFDFTHRKKVSANAIATGKIYVGAGNDDHIIPGKSEMQNVTGVTALQDQLLLESYAERLRKELAGKVEPDVWCDQHDVLVNVLEKQGVKYLVLINDNRTYDDRTGPFKAVMEQLVPQTATVHLRRSEFPDASAVYDLLQHQAVSSMEVDGVVTFEVPLPEIGGTIVALLPRSIERVTIDAPSFVEKGRDYAIRVHVTDAEAKRISGLQPIRIRVTDPAGMETEYSHYTAAAGGEYEFRLTPALNDAEGEWTIAVNDLTAGLGASSKFTVRRN